MWNHHVLISLNRQRRRLKSQVRHNEKEEEPQRIGVVVTAAVPVTMGITVEMWFCGFFLLRDYAKEKKIKGNNQVVHVHK